MNKSRDKYRAGFTFIKVCRFMAYLLLALGTWGSFLYLGSAGYSSLSGSRKVTTTIPFNQKYTAGFFSQRILSVAYFFHKNETGLYNALFDEIKCYNELVADINKQYEIESIPLLYVTENTSYYHTVSFKIDLESAKRVILNVTLNESLRENLINHIHKIEETSLKIKEISLPIRREDAPGNVPHSIGESLSYKEDNILEDSSNMPSENVGQSSYIPEEEPESDATQTSGLYSNSQQSANVETKSYSMVAVMCIAVTMLVSAWLSWALILVSCDFALAHFDTAINTQILVSLSRGKEI
ncbi:MAG: hypothetical protein E7034_04460 [Akkermansiaceae bacterium]|nr:hypothetical protein [Akkermansiaceae bacterium]